MRSLTDEKRAECLWCGCRDGSDDADANECGCDCHDPDSPSYRDEDDIRPTTVPVNTILVAFRAYAAKHRIDAVVAADFWAFAFAAFATFGGWKDWNELDHNFHSFTIATPEEIDHATRVIGHLAALS
jgi:hypothetical protein